MTSAQRRITGHQTVWP